MEFRIWFASRIKELRALEGMRQNDLAENTGLGIASIERIERGATMPTVNTCLLLAKTFGISLSELFRGYF